LSQVIKLIPSPQGNSDGRLRALVFDSFYHHHKGVIIYLKIVDGSLDLKENKQSNFQFIGSGGQIKPLEIGYFTPAMVKTDRLSSGEVGYLATGLKDISLCQVGDTLTDLKKDTKTKVVLLPGYQEPKPVVFFDFYPVENKDFYLMEEAISHLKLNDFSLFYSPTSSPALGKGIRIGFLGVFHAVITQERLERDFDLDIVITSPSVEYQIKNSDGTIQAIQNASQINDMARIKEIREPWVKLTIFTPVQYLGGIIELCQQRRGKLINQEYLGFYINLSYEMPLIELIEGFYDELKSVSSGFASLDYEVIGFRLLEAVKLEVFINRQNIEALSLIVDKNKGERKARKLAQKLKEVIPRQMFETPIQVSLNGRILARETIKAFRKDVTAKLYGGDQTRKDKLLKKQKKGKKRMKQIGQINIPQQAFMAVLEIK